MELPIWALVPCCLVAYVCGTVSRGGTASLFIRVSLWLSEPTHARLQSPITGRHQPALQQAWTSGQAPSRVTVLSALFHLLLATLAARECSRAAEAVLSEVDKPRPVLLSVLAAVGGGVEVLVHTVLALAALTGLTEQPCERSALRVTGTLMACSLLRASTHSLKWAFTVHTLAAVLQQEHPVVFTKQLAMLTLYWPLELALSLHSEQQQSTAVGIDLAGVGLPVLLPQVQSGGHAAYPTADHAHGYMATALCYLVVVHIFMVLQSCFVTWCRSSVASEPLSSQWLQAPEEAHGATQARALSQASRGATSSKAQSPQPFLLPQPLLSSSPQRPPHRSPHDQLDPRARPPTFWLSPNSPAAALGLDCRIASSQAHPPEGCAAVSAGAVAPDVLSPVQLEVSAGAVRCAPAGGPPSPHSGDQLMLLRQALTSALMCGVTACYVAGLGLEAHGLGLQPWRTPSVLCLMALFAVNALLLASALGGLLGWPLVLGRSSLVSSTPMLLRLETALRLVWPIVMILMEPADLYGAYLYHVYGVVACKLAMGRKPFAQAAFFQVAAAALCGAAHALAEGEAQQATRMNAPQLDQHPSRWRSRLMLALGPCQLPEYFLGAAAMLVLQWLLDGCSGSVCGGAKACPVGLPGAVSGAALKQQQQQQQRTQWRGAQGGPRPVQGEGSEAAQEQVDGVITPRPSVLAQLQAEEHQQQPNTAPTTRQGSAGSASSSSARHENIVARNISLSTNGPFGSFTLAAALSPLSDKSAPPPPARAGVTGPPWPARPPSCRQRTTSVISEQIELLLDIRRKGHSTIGSVLLEPSVSLGPQHRPLHRHSHSFRRLQRRDSVASVDNGGLAHFHQQQQQAHAAPLGPSRLAERHVASEVEAETETTDESDTSATKLHLQQQLPPFPSHHVHRLSGDLRSLRRMSSLPSRLRHAARTPAADDVPCPFASVDERPQSRLAVAATELMTPQDSHRAHSAGSCAVDAPGDGRCPVSPVRVAPSVPDAGGWQGAASAADTAVQPASDTGLSRVVGGTDGTAQVRASSLGMAIGSRLAAGSTGAAAGDCLRKEALRQIVMARWRASLSVEPAMGSGGASPMPAEGSGEDMVARTSPPVAPGSYVSSYVSASTGGSVHDGEGLEYQAAASTAAAAAAAASQWPALPHVTAAAAAALVALAEAADEALSHSPRASVGGLTGTGTGSGPQTGTTSVVTGNSRRSLGVSSRNPSIKNSCLSHEGSEDSRSRPAAPTPRADDAAGGAAAAAGHWATGIAQWRLWLGAWMASAVKAAWLGEAGALVLQLISTFPLGAGARQEWSLPRPQLGGEGLHSSLLGVRYAACVGLVLAERMACVAHLAVSLLVPSLAVRWGAVPWALRAVAARPLQRLGQTLLGQPPSSSATRDAWHAAYLMACVRMPATQYGRAVLASVAALAAGALAEQQVTGSGVQPAGAVAALVTNTLRQASQLLCASTAGAAAGLLAARVLPSLVAGFLTSTALRSRLAPEAAARAARLAAFVLPESEALASGASALYLQISRPALLGWTKRAHGAVGAALNAFGGALGFPEAALSAAATEPAVAVASGDSGAYTARLRRWWLQLLLRSFPPPTWPHLPRPSPALVAIAGLLALLLLLTAAQSLLLATLTGDGRRATRLHRRQAALAALKAQLLQAQSVMELLQSLMDGVGEVLAGGSAWCIIVPTDSLDALESATGVLVELRLTPDLRPWPGAAQAPAPVQAPPGLSGSRGGDPATGRATFADGGEGRAASAQAAQERPAEWGEDEPEPPHVAARDEVPAGRVSSGSETEADWARAPAVALADYPSLQLAMAHRTIWSVHGAVSRVYGGYTRLCDTELLTQPTPPDLAQLAAAVGAAGLLVVPLECLAQPYGVLIIACAQPAAVDKDLRLLSAGLADGTAQALYLKQMQAEMAASEMVMQDIYPSHAVQALKRRMHAQGAGLGAGPLAPLTLTSAVSYPVLSTVHSAVPSSPQMDRTPFHVTTSFGGLMSSMSSAPGGVAAHSVLPAGKDASASTAAAVAAVRRASMELCSCNGTPRRSSLVLGRHTDSVVPGAGAGTATEGLAGRLASASTLVEAHTCQPPTSPLAAGVLVASGGSVAGGGGGNAGGIGGGGGFTASTAMDAAMMSPFDAAAAQALSPAAAAVASVLVPGLRPLRVSMPGSSLRQGITEIHSRPTKALNGGKRVPSDPGADQPTPALSSWSGAVLHSSKDVIMPCDVPYARWHPAVTVLFADICGYTATSQALEPEQVMALLHCLFCKYDALLGKYGVYKVETIGDCFMAATGLEVETPSHALNMVRFGRAMIAAAAEVTNPVTGQPLQIRVGINSGRVMSGIVGQCRARYCLFGDTVNTASRMESTGVPGKMQISDETYTLLPVDEQSTWVCRGFTECKGKGMVRTYLG